MQFHRKSGQITIFSIIVLFSVMILAGILVDISRISAGRSIVKSAADSAARSLLADYGSKLKDDYGIFAMPASGEAELNDRFEEYLSRNLSIPEEEEFYTERTDLFGFRIERIHVTPVFNLSENEVTRRQILEYMKYRAPAELVEGFVEKLSVMKDVGKMSAAYKKKVGIDKILGRMDKSQRKLKQTVDGSGNPGDKYINGFNLGGCWEAAFNNFNSLSAKLSSVKSSLDSINSSISALEEQVAQEEKGSKDNAGSGETTDEGEAAEPSGGSAADRTNTAMESLEGERSALQREYSDTAGQLRAVWTELRYSLTGDFIQANENAVNEIQKIVERGKQAQLAIADLEAYLGESFGSGAGEFSGNFREETQAELDRLKELILEGQKAEEMLEDAGGNRELLKRIADRLDIAGNAVGSVASAAGLTSDLVESVKKYAAIRYDYSKPEKGDKREDPRKGKAEAVKNFVVEKILKDVNYITEGIAKEDLPSCTKKETPDFGRKDAEYTGADPSGADGTGTGGESAEYAGELENIHGEADLYDEEGMFQENALGFISDIGRLVSDQAADLRDNLYLNEYIMGTFKNAVPEIEQQNGTRKDRNLHLEEKAGLDTFYDNEVEYILHGNASQKANNIMTKGELLLVRFGLNTLHVYTDAKKKTVAAGIATAVAGWWTGGAGIPILSNLVMAGWGMGEALIDMQDLMEGKSVPIYKLKGDWRLDIGLPSASVPRTDRRLYFNYHDYLRLFLLTMNEEKKLNRVEDLIQLNIGKTRPGFRMAQCSTYVRIEAEVSMKYLFITRPFVQKALKTEDGRYLYKVLLYEGYQ